MIRRPLLLVALLAILAGVVIARPTGFAEPDLNSRSISPPEGLYDPIVAGEPFPGGIRWVVSRDGIRPIYEPSFTGVSQSGLSEDDLVLGVEAQGQAKAYPVGLLAAREIVNDVIAGTPILISWCPLCATGTVHERTLAGRAVRFGNQGALWGNAMTWFDHETGSIWSQPRGEAIAGPLKGERLALLRSDLTTWGEWVEAHPSTQVLEGPVYWAGVTLEELLVVVEIDGHATGYPLADEPSQGVWEGEVGSRPLAIVRHHGIPGGIAVYASDPDGGPLTLRFFGDLLVDTETGTEWDPVSGRAVSGPMAGSSLERLATTTVYPADFETFWPDGSIYVPGP